MGWIIEDLGFSIFNTAKLGHYLTFARNDDDKNGKSVFDFPSWLDSVRGRLHHPITENLGRRSDVSFRAL